MDNSLELDMKMILSSLREIDSSSAEIVELFMHGRNIKDICKELKMSRFKVKRRLDKGLKFVKEMALKEGIVIIRR